VIGARVPEAVWTETAWMGEAATADMAVMAVTVATEAVAMEGEAVTEGAATNPPRSKASTRAAKQRPLKPTCSQATPEAASRCREVNNIYLHTMLPWGTLNAFHRVGRCFPLSSHRP
jgi:hypothetical protein